MSARTLVVLIALLLTACQHAPSPEQNATGYTLIPRQALFGNPERTQARISPDGNWISWLAPVDGVLNVWIAPAGDMDSSRPITRDSGRGIRRHRWSLIPHR